MIFIYRFLEHTKMYCRKLKAHFIAGILLYVITKTKASNGKTFKGKYSKE